MRDYLKTSARIQNGKPVIEETNREQLQRFYNNNNNKTIYLTVSTKRPPRSLEQNAYYWTLLDLLSEYTGDTTQSLHKDLKQEYLPKLFNEQGEQLEPSTTRLNTKEFTDYIERIRKHASEWGLVLPDPIN